MLIYPYCTRWVWRKSIGKFSVCKQKVSGEAEGSLGCERPSPLRLAQCSACPLPQGEGEVDTAKSLPNWGEGKG
jgi:hypothetical protein